MSLTRKEREALQRHMAQRKSEVATARLLVLAGLLLGLALVLGGT